MKRVSIKVFLIELVCKRKATEPLASVPFAPCPPFPSSLLGKREAEHGVKSCLHSPCPAALHSPIPAAPDRDSLLLLQLTAPERGDAGRAAKEEKKGGCCSPLMSTHCSRCCICLDGQSCGEPSALPQHYWILPGMGFLFIEMLRLNCLVEHLAALSLCFYPEASHASGNLDPVHRLQRDNRFA